MFKSFNLRIWLIQSEIKSKQILTLNRTLMRCSPCSMSAGVNRKLLSKAEQLDKPIEHWDSLVMSLMFSRYLWLKIYFCTESQIVNMYSEVYSLVPFFSVCVRCHQAQSLSRRLHRTPYFCVDKLVNSVLNIAQNSPKLNETSSHRSLCFVIWFSHINC